jgi:hypothetical protein
MNLFPGLLVSVSTEVGEPVIGSNLRVNVRISYVFETGGGQGFSEAALTEGLDSAKSTLVAGFVSGFIALDQLKTPEDFIGRFSGLAIYFGVVERGFGFEHAPAGPLDKPVRLNHVLDQTA